MLQDINTLRNTSEKSQPRSPRLRGVKAPALEQWLPRLHSREAQEQPNTHPGLPVLVLLLQVGPDGLQSFLRPHGQRIWEQNTQEHFSASCITQVTEGYLHAGSFHHQLQTHKHLVPHGIYLGATPKNYPQILQPNKNPVALQTVKCGRRLSLRC